MTMTYRLHRTVALGLTTAALACVVSVHSFVPCKLHLPSLSSSSSFATTFSSSSSSSLNAEKSSSSSSSSRRRELLANTAALTTTGSLLVPFVAPPPAQAQANDATTTSTTATAAAPLKLPPMGLGAWAWGDSIFWKYDKKQDDELRRVFDYALDSSSAASPTTTTNNSPVLFDTAELYGFGRSEKLLGEFSKDYAPDRVQIASKFAALPFRTKPKDVVNACLKSVERLGGRPIDLYQIHFPNAWSNAEYWDGLADCYQQGLVKAVGVSNYGSDAVRACHATLKERGIPLTSNQIQLSLLYAYPLDNGLLDTRKELGVQVLSYSPLALGFLTGKYNDANLPQGPRQGLFQQLNSTPDYENLLATMKQIASNHKDATLSQVAINWTRAKGTIPIPGARTVRQVQQNYNALSWKLSKEEEQLLDDASSKVTTFLSPDMNPFPKEDINTKLKMYDS